MKTCSLCKETKELELFYKNKSQPDGRAHWCRKCQSAKQRTRYAVEETPESRAQRRRMTYAWKLKNYYGISIEDVSRMLLAQDNQCLGCTRIFTEELVPCVDHDHVSNAVRGLLCRQCNQIIGLAYEDAASLQRLSTYILQARKGIG